MGPGSVQGVPGDLPIVTQQCVSYNLGATGHEGGEVLSEVL